MRKQLLLILALTLFSNISFGQLNDTLVIVLTTDSNPEETSWKLFDAEDVLIQERTSFESQSTHNDTVLLEKTKCYYWEVYDKFSDGFEGQGSSQDGDFKLYFNGVLHSECNDPAFGAKASAYNIGSICSTNDIEVIELAISDDLFFGENYIKAKVKNLGSVDFTSVECSFTFGDIESENAEIILSLKPGEEIVIEHPTSVYLQEIGDVNVSFLITEVNNQADVSVDNNSVSKQCVINNGFEQIPMHEIFTSSTCPPCAIADPILENILAKHHGKYSVMKHQVSWPENGDPYYNGKYSKPRIDYYNVSSAPTFVVNGESLGSFNDYTDNYFNSLLGKTTNFEVKVAGKVFGDSVVVNVTITATEDIAMSDGFILQTNITEGKTIGNKATNGQKEFHDVMMKILPDADGYELGGLKAFESEVITFKTTMKNTFVEEMSDLKVVAFIQDENVKSVVQSHMQKLEYLGKAPKISFSIDNNEAFGLLDTIVISSDQPIRNIDDSEITSFKNIIDFYVADNALDVVEFSAEINNDKTIITIIPNSELKVNTEYIISIANVEGDNDIAISKSESMFKTITTSLNDESLQNVEVYPNPATDILNVNNKGFEYIELFSVDGKSVRNQKLTFGMNSIGLEELNKGIYVAVFGGSVYSYTIKIIIK